MNPQEIKYDLANFTKDSSERIKKIKAVRILFYPAAQCVRHIQRKKYSESEDSRLLTQFKNIYCGKRCFIIGNGPSLTVDDLEKTTEDITFASNRIFNIYEKTVWRPDYYVAFEPLFTKANIETISQVEVRKAKFINVCAKSSEFERKDLFWIYSSKRYTLNKETIEGIEFSTDISQFVGESYSVTYVMMQIAMYMGFDEIVLLGVDHYAAGMNTHFYKKNKAEYAAPTYLDGIEYGYRLAKEEAAKRGTRIYNATRGGNLEVFERVDFDQITRLGGVDSYYLIACCSLGGVAA